MNNYFSKNVYTIMPAGWKRLAVSLKNVVSFSWLLPGFMVVALTACTGASENIKSDATEGAVTEGGTGEDEVTPSADAFSLTPERRTKTVSIASGKDDSGTPAVVEAELDGELLFNLLAAEFAGNAGNIEASVNFYRKAAEQAADSRIAARAAYIALYGGNYEEALKALDRWHDIEPDADNLLRMYVMAYLKSGQPEKAVPYILKLFENATSTPQENAIALKGMLAKEASVSDSLIVLREINRVETHSNNYMLILQARYEAQENNFDEAIALLDEVYQSDNSMVEVLIIKARILIAQGDSKGAALQIKQALEQRPDNNALRVQYARMLVEQRQLEEAKKHYLIVNENLPENDEVILALALLYIDTKELDKASVELHKLVDIDSRTSVANYYLGRIAQNNGDKKQAIAYYLRVKKERFAFDAQLRIAALLTDLGKPDEGLKKLEILAEDQTDWALRVRIYLAQGEILRSQGRFAEGVEMYSRALQEKRNDPNLLYARGLMAEKVDRLDMAEADFLEVISQDPENANALNALGYTLADRTGRYQEALKYIQRAAALVPDDPAILDSLGWVSYRLGRLDDAEKWLSKAFEKLADAEIAAHYGEVLWVMNKKDKARDVWRKGKKNNANHPVLIETLKRINP